MKLKRRSRQTKNRTKLGEQTEAEQDVMAKRRRKEKVRKIEQDYGKQSQRRGKNSKEGEEESRAAIETELPESPRDNDELTH